MANKNGEVSTSQDEQQARYVTAFHQTGFNGFKLCTGFSKIKLHPSFRPPDRSSSLQKAWRPRSN